MDFEEYDDILVNCKDENEVQRYLEKHGHLLPVNNWILGHQVHCAFIISKFKFGNQFVSDFTYLTKCSDEWYVVFVEIENPKRKFLLKMTILHLILIRHMNRYKIGNDI